MLCYHSSERMSLTTMARDLDMTEEEVERAFRYWARDGLCKQVGDNPVCFKLYNLKQLTLTRAQTPSEQLYHRDFMDEINRVLDAQTLGDNDRRRIFDWVDVLELPEEVVLMLLQTERQNSRTGRVSIAIADKTAREWAQGGVKTVEDVEKIVIIGRERENNLRKLLARLGMRRTPSDDEKAMYNKWLDDWGFTPEAVQEACRETTKGTPTMAYLDGILLRQHQLGRHEAQLLSSGIAKERTARDFAREVCAGLGRTGVTPTQDDLSVIESWRERGFGEELILMAVTAAHRRAGGGSMDDVDSFLEKWKKQGLVTPDAVRAESARIRALNAQLREIYDAAGLEKRPNAADRELLCRWAGEMGMSHELIVLAAQYARGGGSPMLFTGRILSDWQHAGITTPEAARAEHEAHVRNLPQGSARTQPAAQQDVMQRHAYTHADYQRMVIDLDEEEN